MNVSIYICTHSHILTHKSHYPFGLRNLCANKLLEKLTIEDYIRNEKKDTWPST